MKSRQSKANAFTIIELLVSMSIVMILLVVLFQMVGQTSSIWKYTNAKSEQFRGARAAFEAITRQLSQATLNTYWDYDRDAQQNIKSTKYVRNSELRFISGPASDLLERSTADSGHAIFFQAPMGFVEDSAKYGGLDNLLNTWGYFVDYNSDLKQRPPFIDNTVVPERMRFRLMEYMEPSEKLSIYNYTSGSDTSGLKSMNYSGKDWFKTAVNSDLNDQGIEPKTHVLAENIVALVFIPKLPPKEDPDGSSLAPKYLYDSTVSKPNEPAINPKNQLPPVVQVTMVAIDEESAARLSSRGVTDLGVANLFRTNSPADLKRDLDTLEQTLRDQNVKYRVFSTDVAIRGAKWSRE